MGDIKSTRLIIAKGILFLLLGLIAGGMILVQRGDLATFGLLVICVWGFCRFYFFAFYVIEKYIDDDYRFDGLYSVLIYLAKRNEAKK